MPNRQNIFYYLTGILALGFAVFLLAPRAKAAEPSWSGCGLGLHGSYGQLDKNGTTSTGETVGASLLCDLQLDRMVIGAFVDADRVFGQVHTDGVNYGLSFGGRAGVLLNSATLIYGHGETIQYSTEGGTFNGTAYGAGVEMRLGASPNWFTDFRYTHSDIDGATADAIRGGIVYKFHVPGLAAAPLK